MTVTPDLLLTSADIELLASQGKAKRLLIVAYSGDAMNVAGFGDIAIDLSGMTLPASLPILSDHRNELSSVIASGTPSVKDGRLIIVATLADSEAAKAVVALLTSGMTLQASVGATPAARRQIGPKETAIVNGRSIVSGPNGLTVVDTSVLKEVSVTPLGADASTSVSIAAKKEKIMDPKLRQFITEMGGDPNNLTPEQMVRAEFNFRGEAPPESVADGTLAGESRRIEAISAIEPEASIARYNPQHETQVSEIKARAIEGGWSVNKTELEILRASRPRGPQIYQGGGHNVNNNDVLQAALLSHLGHDSLGEKTLGPNVMQRGRELRCTSLMDVVKASLQLNNIQAPLGRDEMIKAAFSTMSLPGVLGDSASKMLLDSYNAFPSVARIVFKKLSARDFKTTTSYRMTAATTFEKVPPAGVLKHGTFSESSYPYSVETYGKMFSLTRQDIINDDLGAFESMPRQIGRGAAECVEDLAWTLVLANTGSFFASGNSNYISGGTTSLGSAGLVQGVSTMLKQVDENGKPISVFPKYLVVPPEVKSTADELYASRTVNTGNNSALDRIPNANAFHGLYEPLVAPYLSNTSYVGYSLTAWFLFGDPADVPAFGLAYLNGNENPTIETSQSDFATLGIQFRGFLDIGTCQLDPRGAIKSAGA